MRRRIIDRKHQEPNDKNKDYNGIVHRDIIACTIAHGSSATATNLWESTTSIVLDYLVSSNRSSNGEQTAETEDRHRQPQQPESLAQRSRIKGQQQTNIKSRHSALVRDNQHHRDVNTTTSMHGSSDFGSASSDLINPINENIMFPKTNTI